MAWSRRPHIQYCPGPQWPPRRPSCKPESVGSSHHLCSIQFSASFWPAETASHSRALAPFYSPGFPWFPALANRPRKWENTAVKVLCAAVATENFYTSHEIAVALLMNIPFRFHIMACRLFEETLHKTASRVVKNKFEKKCVAQSNCISFSSVPEVFACKVTKWELDWICPSFEIRFWDNPLLLVIDSVKSENFKRSRQRVNFTLLRKMRVLPDAPIGKSGTNVSFPETLARTNTASIFSRKTKHSAFFGNASHRSKRFTTPDIKKEMKNKALYAHLHCDSNSLHSPGHKASIGLNSHHHSSSPFAPASFK